MTVKDLIEKLSTQPQDGMPIFKVWGLKGDGYTYFIVRGEVSEEMPTAYGNTAVSLGNADYCRAHTMIEKDGVLHH